MYGDFSTVKAFRGDPNWTSVLHQQGRVLLDSDWNAQSKLTMDWEDAAASATFGHGVLAVETDEGDAFKVVGASVSAGEVTLSVRPGAAWADGKRVVLTGADTVERLATHFDEPIQSEPGDIGAVGSRDGVVLEVYRETIHGYQRPELLIEEALGGPDTTERVKTAMRFRLVRMLEGESCDDLPDRIADDPEDRGTLTVDLEPGAVLPEPCPQVDTGGYTGLEHQMYRVEIARLGAGYPLRFKYSRFNGGLVGRGVFSAAARMLSIHDGRQSIDRAKLEDAYLEAFVYDENLGHWDLVYGADVSLSDSAGKIELPAPGSTEERFGSIPTSGEAHFFRLWDGTGLVSDFIGGPTELVNGIRLEFAASTGSNYRAGDYWVFDVRAGEVSNSQTLIDDSPPEGVYYTRVPIGVLEWTGPEIAAAAEDIEDCRRPFNPLTKLGSCCRYRVGDGVHSHGDFDSIQEAVDRLPASGGEICVLPGDYEENIEISLRHDVVIKGCGSRTRVKSKSLAPDVHKPVFSLVDSRDIRVESMTVVADENGPGIAVDGGRAQVRSIHLERLRVLTAKRSGIEVRTGSDIVVRHNFVIVSNGGDEWPAVTLRAVDSLIEHNTIVGARPSDEMVVAEALSAHREFATIDDVKALRKVVPSGDVVGSDGIYDIAANIPGSSAMPFMATSASDENVEEGLRYAIAREPEAGKTAIVGLGTAERINGAAVTTADGLGGLWLRGGCQRVRVVDNLIAGGGGNGITLGDIRTRTEEGDTPKFWTGGFPFYRWQEEDCGPEGPIVIWIPPKPDPETTETQIAGEPLSDIRIERNRIAAMGTNGIGVLGFFPNTEQGTIAVDRLALLGNDIRGCLWRRAESVSDEMLGRMGFGGVALGAVSDLRAYDNVITGNGRSHLDPVCGIYVFHAEHADIQRNHITNNGPQSGEDIDGARRGSRAGIYFELASSPWEDSPRQRTTLLKRPLTLRNAPAVTIQGNTVSQPLGPAIRAVGLGSMSVANNHLASHGVEVRASASGGVVSILNLGVSHDAALAAKGAARKGLVGSFSMALATGHQLANAELAEATSALSDTDLVTASLMVGGDVEFVGNQCVLDLVDLSADEAKFAVTVATLGDLVFANNQCDALLEIGRNRDKIMANVFALAATGRFLGNRLTETPGTTRLSGVSMTATTNTTSNNHSTHCLLILGGVPPYKEGNFTLLDLAGRDVCSIFGGYLGALLAIGGEAGVVEQPSDEAKKGLDVMKDTVLVLDQNRAKGYTVLGTALEAEAVIKDYELADLKIRYEGTDPRVLAAEKSYVRTKNAGEAIGYAEAKATAAVTEPRPNKFTMVGYVLDEGGQPKEGANVLLRDAEGRKIPGATENVTTNSSGKYEILVDEPPETEAFVHIRESGKRDYISREKVALEKTGKEFRDVIVTGEKLIKK